MLFKAAVHQASSKIRNSLSEQDFEFVDQFYLIRNPRAPVLNRDKAKGWAFNVFCYSYYGG